MGHGEPPHHFGSLGGFAALRLEEFEAGRDGMEEIAHLDLAAAPAGGGRTCP